MITSEELLMKLIKGEKGISEELSFTERTTAISQYCRYLRAMDYDPNEIESLLDNLLKEQGDLYVASPLFYKVYFKQQYSTVSETELREVFDTDLTAVWLPNKISLGYSYLNMMIDLNRPEFKSKISDLVTVLDGWIEERGTNPKYKEFR